MDLVEHYATAMDSFLIYQGMYIKQVSLGSTHSTVDHFHIAQACSIYSLPVALTTHRIQLSVHGDRRTTCLMS